MEFLVERVERVTLKAKSVEVTVRIAGEDEHPIVENIEFPWTPKEKAGTTRVEPRQSGTPDQKLLQSVVRAHAWLRELSDGTHASIESLAIAAKLHPKVIRQALRLAFLTPEITQSILHAEHPAHLSLATIPNALALGWADPRQLL